MLLRVNKFKASIPLTLNSQYCELRQSVQKTPKFIAGNICNIPTPANLDVVIRTS